MFQVGVHEVPAATVNAQLKAVGAQLRRKTPIYQVYYSEKTNQSYTVRASRLAQHFQVQTAAGCVC